MDGDAGENRGEEFPHRIDGAGGAWAIASVIAGALGIFPAAVGLGIVAVRRLPRGHPYRGVGAAGALLGALETAGFAVLLGFVFFHDPFPARREAAVDQLRKIIAAQEKFKASALADQDGDGVGEYGLLPELARGRSLIPSPARDEKAGHGFVSAVFKHAEISGITEKYGYCFLVFLPGRDWSDALEGKGGVRESNPAFANGQERSWIAYAWPAVDGKTATAVFVAGRFGIYRAENRIARFDGEVRMPRAFSALTGTGPAARVPVSGAPSLCNETWTKAE